MPEYLIDGKKLIPEEVSVIIGYVQSPKQSEWIKDKGYYNVRIGVSKGAKDANTKGAIHLTTEFAGANYILLRGKKDKYLSRMMTIRFEKGGETKRYLGPQIVSRKELLALGYPEESTPAKEAKKENSNYLLYQVAETHEDMFGNQSWDHRKLEEQLPSREGPNAYAVRLSELMKTVVKG